MVTFGLDRPAWVEPRDLRFCSSAQLLYKPLISPEGRVGGAKAAVRRASSRREPRQSCEEIPKIPPPLGVGQTPWSHGYVTTFGVIEWHPDRDALSTSRAAAALQPRKMLRSPRSPARHHDCSCRQRLASCTLMPSRKHGSAAHRVARACLTPVIDADCKRSESEKQLVECSPRTQ